MSSVENPTILTHLLPRISETGIDVLFVEKKKNTKIDFEERRT